MSPNQAILVDGALAMWCDEARAVPSPPAGFALPDGTLALLRRIIELRKMSRVFEFGCGRSTQLFLGCGCEVTSIDDSGHWLARSTAACPAPLLARHRPVLQRLATLVDGLAPFRAWRLGLAERDAIRAADLVLVDSPAFAPFREYALLNALRLAPQALVVVDDARDPEVRGFCVRIAEANHLPWLVSDLDHGLFFTAAPGPGTIRSRRGPLATLQTWRRMFRFAGYVLRSFYQARYTRKRR